MACDFDGLFNPLYPPVHNHMGNTEADHEYNKPQPLVIGICQAL
jgi:hypothetical protein